MGVRCTHCDVLSRADAVVCRACGHPLPQVVAAQSPTPPVPPPPTPPTLLRMRQPAPLKPPSLDVVPPARPKAAPAEGRQGELFVGQSAPLARGPMPPQRVVSPPPIAPPVAAESRGPASAAPPVVPHSSSDTLPPDTLPPDTLPPDTLPPDTLPPGTLPPGTLPPDTLHADSSPPVVLSPVVPSPVVPSPVAPSPVVPSPVAPSQVAPSQPHGGPRATPPPGAVPRDRVGIAPSTLRSEPGGPPAGTYRIAGAARLAAALLIDLLLAAAPGGALFTQAIALELSSLVPGLAAFGAGYILMHAFCVPRWGGTPGALLLGLRLLTRAEGAAVGLPRAALRGALGAVETLCFLLGPLWAVWLDPEARTLADRMLGVVPVERQGQGR